MNSCEEYTDEVKSLIDSEHYPRDIQSQLEVTGSERGLVLNRDVSFTLSGYYKIDEQTGSAELVPMPWDSISLTFAEDLQLSTPVLSTSAFPVVDKGVFDPDFDPDVDSAPNPDNMERWQGILLASELNKLDGYEWVVAQLKGDNEHLISRCVFKVLGGQ